MKPTARHTVVLNVTTTTDPEDVLAHAVSSIDLGVVSARIFKNAGDVLTISIVTPTVDQEGLWYGVVNPMVRGLRQFSPDALTIDRRRARMPR